MQAASTVVPTEVLKALTTLQTAVEATKSSAAPLITKSRNADPSLDLSAGLSLLLARPHVLLSSLHHLVLLLALRLSTQSNYHPDAESSSPASLSLASGGVPSNSDDMISRLAGELLLGSETLEKVRGLESKLDYQIKKLVGLAEAEETKGLAVVEKPEEDPLAFRPNMSAIASMGISEPERLADESDRAESSAGAVYRPPRVAAVPYREADDKVRRKARRAPALLSEFAATMDGAPLLESTSGLSTRPVQVNRHSNSISAKRAAELQRMNEFEEENMTRLVTTKREAKRRREDEEALALGYGVGGSARGRARRQNGLEAELEGVLGARGSRGVWDNVSQSMGRRADLLERGKASQRERASGGDATRAKKARFDKDIVGRKRR
ncbi:hypothetical protein JCM24511_02428 [Saitozyma sp. JCM 24511]|nr:hypothetical protein JCM24511_02428 [Saitozyma sp. JCM 24511]